MSRKVCISAVDGQTGFLIAELLLTSPDFSNKVDAVVGLALHPHSPKCKELEKLGATIIPHKPGKEREMVKTLKESGADTVCLIPPTHKDKYDITVELVNATKKAGVPNVCLLSSAGADMASAEKQPRLREFIDIEQLVMSAKGDPNTETGHSPVVIRYVHDFQSCIGTTMVLGPAANSVSVQCRLLYGESLELRPPGSEGIVYSASNR